MDRKDQPIGGIIFYGAVTAILMGTAVFGAIEGWFGSAIISFDGGPRLSDSGYIAFAAGYGLLCGAGCPFPLLILLWVVNGFLRPVSMTNRRITNIWLASIVSACLFAVILMVLSLTLFASGDNVEFMLLVAGAAVPPGVQGLRVIIHMVRRE